MIARRLARSTFGPGLSLGAFASAALGVGVFSGAISLALHITAPAVPYPDPARLLTLTHTGPGLVEETHPERVPAAVAEALTLEREAFSTVAAFKDNQGLRLTGSGSVIGVVASHDFLDALGIAPRFGRSFEASEDQPGAGYVMIVSHDFWQSHFGGAEDIVGRVVQAEHSGSFTVVGVLPRGVGFPVLGNSSFYVPLGNGMGESFLRQPARTVMARARGDASAAELAAATERAVVQGLRATGDIGDGAAASIRLVPYRGGFRVSDSWQLLGTLVAASLLLLAVAVTNIGTLTALGARRHEQTFAIRAALGASHARTTAAVTGRALLPVAAGIGAGLWLSAYVLDAIRAVTGPDSAFLIPHLDVRSAAVSALVLIGGALCAVAVPVWRLRGRRLSDVLVGRGTGWNRSGLDPLRWSVGAQVGVGASLLFLGVLFGRAVDAHVAIDRGYRTDDVFVLALPSEVDLTATYAGGLRDDPALRRGGVAVGPPPVTPVIENSSGVVRARGGESQGGRHWLLGVSAEYAAVTAIALREGRFFDASEVDRGGRVAVVDEALADRLWPGQAPVGRTLELRGEPDFESFRVVGTTRTLPLRDARSGLPVDQIFIPFTTAPERAPTLIVALADGGTPGEILDIVGRHATLDPGARPVPFTELVQRTASVQLLYGRALRATAALGLVIALVGLFSVVGHATHSRVREFGVRRALGSTSGALAFLAVRDGLGVTLWGAAIGLLAAIGAAIWIRPLILGVVPTDPVAITAAVVVVGVSSVLACLGPALAAARCDPVELLRAER